MRELEVKRQSGSLSEDEKDELRTIRKMKGLPVDDIGLSEEDTTDLEELEKSIAGAKGATEGEGDKE